MMHRATSLGRLLDASHRPGCLRVPDGILPHGPSREIGHGPRTRQHRTLQHNHTKHNNSGIPVILSGQLRLQRPCAVFCSEPDYKPRTAPAVTNSALTRGRCQ